MNSPGSPDPAANQPPIRLVDGTHGDDTGYCLVDRRGDIVAANEAFQALAAWPNAGAVPATAALAGMAPPADLAARLERVLSGQSRTEQLTTPDPLSPDAPRAWVAITALRGAGEPLALVRISQRRAVLAAAVDPLTHLPDRRAIADRAAAWRQAAGPAAPRFAVLFLDLDGFKSVNDRHGHAVGDAVLQELAARWLRCVREGDLVARYGGDEFVVLVRDAATAAEIEPVIRRLRAATREPVRVGELSLTVDATVGWAASSGSDAGIEALVAAADHDMYARKRRVVR
jgi:diguanylate cyclase (GGDEF)-like protein